MMKAFTEILDLYSEEVKAKNDGGHKPGQVREKFTEIVEAAGFDCRLLRINYPASDKNLEKLLAAVNNQSEYYFPDASAEFVVSVLKRHTTKEFKFIRKADFSKASGETLKWLVDGFTKMLMQFEYPISVIIEQKKLMEKRFDLKAHLALERIQDECQKLIEQAESFVGGLMDFNVDDEECFLQYMASSLAGLGNYMDSVHAAYVDVRSDELYNLAVAEVENISIRDIELDYQETEAINADKELQEWINKRSKIIGEYDFVKNKRKEFNVINARINERLQMHHEAVYGVKDVANDAPLAIMYPTDVLYEAILYVEEDSLPDQVKEYRCRRLVKTREQIQFESEEAKRILTRFDEEFRKRMEEQDATASGNTEP